MLRVLQCLARPLQGSYIFCASTPGPLGPIDLHVGHDAGGACFFLQKLGLLVSYAGAVPSGYACNDLLHSIWPSSHAASAAETQALMGHEFGFVWVLIIGIVSQLMFLEVDGCRYIDARDIVWSDSHCAWLHGSFDASLCIMHFHVGARGINILDLRRRLQLRRTVLPGLKRHSPQVQPASAEAFPSPGEHQR